MFINFEECMELRESVSALQTRLEHQNWSGQVALAVWQMQYNPVW